MRTIPVLGRFFASRARPISRHGLAIPAYLNQAGWFELAYVCGCRMSKSRYTQVSIINEDLQMGYSYFLSKRTAEKWARENLWPGIGLIIIDELSRGQQTDYRKWYVYYSLNAIR